MPEDVMDTQTPVDQDTTAPDGTGVAFEELPIPETYKDNPNVSKYKSVGELIKGHENAVKLVGAKGVIVPKDDAPQEEKDKFLNTLGRPENPEGYKLSPVELHPKIKAAYTPEVEGVFKSEMHKIGLTQAQADALHKWYFEAASKGEVAKEEATNKSIKDGEVSLRKQWGAEYDSRIANARKVVAKFGGQAAIDALGDIGSHPAVVKMMGEIATHFSEDAIKSFGDKQPEGAQGAKEKIKSMRSDPKHPLNLENHPDHNNAVKELTELYKEAYPDA